MRNLLFIASLLLTIVSYAKVDTLYPMSTIKEVTVFFNGAQVNRKANLKLEKGKHLLFFDQLPQEITPSSIQVEGQESIQILSVKHQLNYKDQGRKSDQEKAIFDQIDASKLEVKKIKDQINVFDIEERILLENSKIYKGKDGATVEQLAKTADFYRKRLNAIRSGKHDLRQQIIMHEKELNNALKKVNELTVKKRKTHSQVLIAIECDKMITEPIRFSYYISSAGWEPIYDFRVKDIASPLSIVYNANVFQSSGEDWKDVDIVLSSNNPLLSGNKPSMGSLYLGKEKQVVYKTNASEKATLTGRIFDRSTGEALPFCNVGIYKDNREIRSTTTDRDGMYTIKPIPSGSYSVKASYVGYNPSEFKNLNLKNNQIALQDLALGKVVDIDLPSSRLIRPLYEKDQSTSGTTRSRKEIEQLAVRSVADIAKTAGNGVYARDNGFYGDTYYPNGRTYSSQYNTSRSSSNKRAQEETNFISNSLKHNVTHLEYSIKIPYSIPSDGENYSLKIKEVNLDVEYIYYAVPKLDKDAFLTAKLSDWNDLNLLSGKTSIYYEGTFTSQSYLDVQSADDTLSISLGRDKGININRVGDKSLYDKRRNGKDLVETIGWQISVRNNKPAKIKLIVEDQYPLSDRKSIEVELLESSFAKRSGKTGKLSWEIELHPEEKKEINFSYAVKYPRYSDLVLE